MTAAGWATRGRKIHQVDPQTGAIPRTIESNRIVIGITFRAVIRAVVAADPYDGLCPCCGAAAILAEDGRVADGAEYDHLFHRGLNKPEHAWRL